MDENELLARYGLIPLAAALPEIRQLIQSFTADDKRDSILLAAPASKLPKHSFAKAANIKLRSF
jgi:hypothetical protein